MNSSISPGVLLALLVVAIVIVGLYFFVRSKPSSSRQGAALSRARTTVATARDVKELAQQLQKSSAQWPAILATLNPTSDGQIMGQLQALRGPHMFKPDTGLTVIIHGCDIALRKTAKASALSGLQEAQRSMEKVTRFGD